MPNPSRVWLTFAAFLGSLAHSAGAEPWLQWTFEEKEPVRPGEIRLGLQGYRPGVSGSAAVFDGFTTAWSGPVPRPAQVGQGLTLQGWVVCGAYPMLEGPLVDLWPDEGEGLALAIQHEGRLALRGRQGGQTFEVLSEQRLPLRRWQHVAAVLHPSGQVELWLQGQPAGQAQIALSGGWRLGSDWRIGRSRGLERPAGTLRPEATAKAPSFIDGLLDAWSVEERVFSPAELAQGAARPQAGQEAIALRVMPTGPAGAGPFGAFASTLPFYPEWDHHWRVRDHADVVVRFPQHAGRLVFWRGTSYIPHWVTENGIWYTNEFNETWGDILGCGEPMSDKQCRYSRVQILESGPARAVVHWRYALTDVFYTIARPQAENGWGDWTDELYTVYPDGTAVRSVTLHTSQPDQPHEWHEAIVVMGQDWSPERALEPEGLTLISPQGEETTVSWRHQTPPYRPAKPETVGIHYVNTKSQWKPFVLLRPQDRANFNIFAKEVRREVSMYPWWNHWPTNMQPSDGRYAFAADRPSHASLSNIDWAPYREQGVSTTKIMLTGLTDRPARELMPMLRSWATPPPGSLNGVALAYDPEQRAYLGVVAQPGTQTLQWAASPQQPLSGTGLVLRGWGTQACLVKRDGVLLQPGRDYEQQIRRGLEGNDLVLWLPITTEQSLSLVVEPAP